MFTKPIDEITFKNSVQSHISNNFTSQVGCVKSEQRDIDNDFGGI